MRVNVYKGVKITGDIDLLVNGTWIEAKGIKFNPDFTKFTSQMARNLKQASDLGLKYEVHTNFRVEGKYLHWLNKKGIPFFEHLGD